MKLLGKLFFSIKMGKKGITTFKRYNPKLALIKKLEILNKNELEYM